MYCKKCGRYIESGSICSDCAAEEYGYVAPDQLPQYNAQAQYNAEAQYNAQYQYNPEAQYNAQAQYNPQPQQKAYTSNLPEPNNRMYGFGKALTSTILGIVGFLWVYISIILGAIEGDAVVLAVLAIVALPLIIIPLIFGISSIKVFTSRKSTCAKPIATLILGITGLSFAAISAFIDFCMLIVSVSV